MRLNKYSKMYFKWVRKMTNNSRKMNKTKEFNESALFDKNRAIIHYTPKPKISDTSTNNTSEIM